MSLVQNKKLHLNYEIKDTLEAGIELFGNEVKAIRNSQAQIDGAKVIIRGGEAFIVGMNIQPYQKKSFEKEKDNDRTRRLLLKKSEILSLATNTEKGLFLFPKEIYDAHGLLKLSIAICKKKNAHDKRETIRKKDEKRIKEY